jgi:flavin reductase (DIM6/NTAB) family NADH-FMN oxidoreductase RutF
MQIDPTTVPPREIYFRMISMIVPRPIAWVSTVSAEGVGNLAPFSFFTGVTSLPPTLVFCVGNKRGGVPKDTAANILATGEFVVNVVPYPLTEAMVQTSGSYSADVDEFDVAGLATIASARVTPPRIQGVPISIECRLHQCVPIEAEPGRVTSRMFIGRIELIHLDDDVLDSSGAIDPARLDLVSRLGGQGYARIGERFEVPRPTV